MSVTQIPCTHAVTRRSCAHTQSYTRILHTHTRSHTQILRTHAVTSTGPVHTETQARHANMSTLSLHRQCHPHRHTEAHHLQGLHQDLTETVPRTHITQTLTGLTNTEEDTDTVASLPRFAISDTLLAIILQINKSSVLQSTGDRVHHSLVMGDWNRKALK